MSVLSKRTHRIMVHASGESTICHEKDGLDHVGHVLSAPFGSTPRKRWGDGNGDPIPNPNPSSLFSSSMRWEMEIEEVEAVLERIWDLHDKISDAIHAISRAHFLRSVKGLRGGRQPPVATPAAAKGGGEGGEGKGGFVFVKDFRVEEDGAAMAEARSLNDIRSALENLEDQLEFFHTVQSQQRAERDAAIAVGTKSYHSGHEVG
ncbi:hypothetical protein MUK42_25021 [Musa troglodytarum]|uniref:Uncharacterized protein n=1 Tax=Musa troglodytarum TaxID=320322 RepID=A0A9E7LCR3_9LILI|nr:hypothetical protein MUK42_25021 [Musa troglodytarum]URE45981.1 hypothetical protein MUK42_25021 [Musa troglodytarum]